MKGTGSGNQTANSTQSNYKAKENNSGVSGPHRQRNTVYVPSSTNFLLMGNAMTTQSGNGLHKNSGSIGATGHRG